MTGTRADGVEAPRQPSQPERLESFDSTAGIFGYLCLCLNVLFFCALSATKPSMFDALCREDYWVESLTAAWFLIAGILLFITACREGVGALFLRCVYIVGATAMVFAAGEEISWGQRIFGFATPDWLMQANEQQEFTVHNLANKSFDFVYLNSVLILCMTTSAAFFCGKDRISDIPLPSILLMLGFLVAISYESGDNLKDLSGDTFREYLVGVKRSFGFIVIEEKGLLLLFFIFTLFAGHVKLAIACAATLALVFALTYVNHHSNVRAGSVFEVREYLFGIGCLAYCSELFLTNRQPVAISRASAR